jgi:hypothetical protein
MLRMPERPNYYPGGAPLEVLGADIPEMAARPSELQSFSERKVMITRTKKMVPRDSSRDRMKEMNALERRQRANRCKRTVSKRKPVRKPVKKPASRRRCN